MADRKALFEQLAESHRLVTLSEERIRAQKRIIAELEREGQDSHNAKEVLVGLERSHAGHVETRNDIRDQLSFR